MPFVPDDDPGTRGATGGLPEPVDTSDMIGAAFRQQNLVVSIAHALANGGSFTPEPGHNPLDVIRGTPYEHNHLDAFLGSHSEAETRSIMEKIDREDTDRRVNEAAGTAGALLDIIAGTLDPTILLPSGAIVKAGRAGYSVGRSALSIGLAAGAQALTQEAGLQASQVTRPVSQSAIAVGSATLLGGLLGAGASKLLSSAERRALTQVLDRERVNMQAHVDGVEPPIKVPAGDNIVPFPDLAAAEPPLASAAGAAATDTRRLDMQGHGLEFTDRISPTRRTMAADSIEARRTMADLAEMPYRFEDNAEGVATTQGPALDRLARMEINGKRVAVSDEFDRLFAEYRFGDPNTTMPRMRAQFERLAGRDGDYMSFHEFKQEIGKALQEGDKHDIPQVEQAAQYVRNNVFEPWKQRAIDAKLLGEDVDVRTAESYFQRVYNKEAIAAKRPEFVDRITSWLQSDQETKRQAQSRISTLHDQLRAHSEQVQRFEDRLQTLADRQKQVSARLSERAMEVGRAEKRTGVLDERSTSIAEELSEIGEFIATMRREVRSPELLARVDQLEREASVLRRADRPMTEAQLRKVENEELGGILTGVTKRAAEILTGRRNPRTPKFIDWLASSGGVRDPGGDIAYILDKKLARRVVNNIDGWTLDELTERIAEEAPGRFPHRDEPGGVLPSHSDVLNWISEAAHGREPDWWLESLSQAQKGDAEASLIATMLDRAFSEAGVDVKTPTDVARVLRDQRFGAATLADLDRLEASLAEAGQSIPVSIRRAGAEEELRVTKGQIDELRGVIKRAMAARESKERRLKSAEARGSEALMAENANRGRLGVLEERLSLGEQRRQLLADAAEVAGKMRDDARAKIEAEIAAWEGKSAGDAKAALKAREKYAAGAERAVDAPRLTAADEAVDRAVRRILGSDRDMDESALRDRAHEITDRILGSADGRLPYDLHTGAPEVGWHGAGEPPRGPLASRDFAIPDALIRDFLDMDAERIVSTHLRTIVPDVMLTERFGDVRMTEAFKRINEEYQARIDAARDKPKELKRLENERQAVIRDIAAVRDRVRGSFGYRPDLRNMARVANSAKAINNLTSMGVSAISSIPDFAGVVFRHGMEAAFGDGWAPFLRSLMGNAEAKEAIGQARAQWRAVGIGVETAINARQHVLDDITDLYRPASRVERALQYANDKFFIANLLAPLTDIQKLIAANVTVAEILRAAKAVSAGTATKKQVGKLAASNIDPMMAGRIWTQFDTKGGEVIDGVHLPNTADWTDREAARALEGAVARDVDIAVVTPGQEKPLWMSDPLLSVLGQFKSFTAAATERIVVANLQSRDAATLQGLVVSLGLGMLSYKLNAVFSGQKTSDRPQDWVKEGISRSGISGWFEDGNALASKMTRGGVDAYRLIGADKPLSRYASRSTLDMLLGPTAGKIEGLSKVTGAAAARDWKESDTTALRRLMFFQNLFYVRRLFNEAETGFNHAFGIPMKEAQ